MNQASSRPAMARARAVGRPAVSVAPALLLVLGAACGPAPVPEAPTPPAPRTAPVTTLATAPAVRHAVIPAPERIDFPAAPGITLNARNTVILVAPGDTAAARIGGLLARRMGTSVETTPRVLTAAELAAAPYPPRPTLPPTLVPRAADTLRAPATLIELALDAARGDLGDEGYELTVAEEGIRVVGARRAGLFYGTQTLVQLMPTWIEYTALLPRPVRVPAAHVVDRPRYEWRGLMLDVSRHFLGVEDVKRFIDHAAAYKLNRLHLHLTEDQGWRIEVPSWPDLTRIGGRTAVGGHPGGYYTRQDYAALVRYADERFVTVVPEVDMPGHTNAALTSYPELNCDGVAPPAYMGTRVGFSALCPGLPVTYRFIEDVVREIAELTTGPYFHIGGDEVETIPHDDYLRFIERIEGIVRGQGKRMIGWGEIAPARLDPSSIVQHWRRDSSFVAAARGNRIILSPSPRVYLDMKYDSATAPGLAWAATISTRRAYDWEPSTYLENVPPEAILGIEAPLWSETVATRQEFEYLIFPRLLAVAELAWSLPDRRGWDGFRLRLAHQGPRLSARGINFHRDPEVPWVVERR
jgi:hexosaminidase